MAILTENKIRKLLRTTDLKATKILCLEPGTIITPAAKGYLNGVTVTYCEQVEKPTESEIALGTHPSEVVTAVSNPIPVSTRNEPAGNQITWSWNIQVELLISEVLAGQQLSFKLKQDQLTQDLKPVLDVLRDFRKLDFCNDYWSHYQVEKEKYSQEIAKRETAYSPEDYIPSYSDEEAVMIYQLYTKVRHLQITAYSCMQAYLLFDDFYCLLEGCRWMAEYLWILMIRKIEDNNKGRRI